MCVKEKTFIELIKSGKAGPGDLDDFIAEWHNGNDRRELSAAIGLSVPQYAEWVRGKASIMDFVPTIKAKRRRKLAAA